jgi:predicted esterase
MKYRMRRMSFVLLAVFTLASTAAFAARDAKGPKTGYFEVRTTLVEMLGEEGAKNFSESLEPDKHLRWQLFVPSTYSADDPPGVIVFVSANRRGGPARTWNDTLESRNLIWIGLNHAGGTAPVMERILTAIIAPLVLRGDYEIDFSRIYIAGHSDGGQVASMVMMSKPEQFRGGIYLGAAEAWDDEAPPKIDLIRENRHAFLIGANDNELKEMQRVFNRYTKAGVKNVELIRMRNNQNSWPAGEFLGRAIDFLDDRDRPAEN